MSKSSRLAKAVNIRDVKTIQELALTVQESFPYNTETNRKAEQIYELANQLESLIEDGTDNATPRIK